MNLISLDELDSRGCIAFVENESMMILRGVWVILEVRKAGSLYELLENTVQGGAVLSFASWSNILYT